jgi:hypothetical protein
MTRPIYGKIMIALLLQNSSPKVSILPEIISYTGC